MIISQKNENTETKNALFIFGGRSNIYLSVLFLLFFI